ncbi:SMU1112c/YaeR family gloxylase I-like metalloprotein [Terrilactibacillus laevilacticus]|uniref:SMU1112c/YaeR family gloxylase I-like metalloprotein n=1 Tax=Terrilactibacillus laevilacticus TaxID=1380157 RepID=UPI0011461B92|nr:VOC family protein [Terrilactibacillus laevilacticus]
MEIMGIHHIAIICSDYEKSKHFYVNILGCQVIHELYREERQSYKCDLRLGESDQIELFSFPSPPGRLTHPEACGLRHLAFKVKDINQAKLELEEADIEVESIRKDPITGKLFTFFQDPDHLPLELYEI